MNEKRDRDIQTFFKPLKQVKTPSGLRQANRDAITRALGQAENHWVKRISWWQRRISVPLPVAAAVLLVIGLQLYLQFHSGMRPHNPHEVAHQEETRGGESVLRERDGVEIQYQQKAVYLAGLGTIHTEEIYHFEEL